MELMCLTYDALCRTCTESSITYEYSCVKHQQSHFFYAGFIPAAQSLAQVSGIPANDVKASALSATPEDVEDLMAQLQQLSNRT